MNEHDEKSISGCDNKKLMISMLFLLTAKYKAVIFKSFVNFIQQLTKTLFKIVFFYKLYLKIGFFEMP